MRAAPLREARGRHEFEPKVHITGTSHLSLHSCQLLLVLLDRAKMTTIVQSQPWPRTDDAIRALLDSGEPAVLRDGPVVGVDTDSVAARLGRMLR